MADLRSFFDFYTGLGYAPHLAAAMAGNIMSEGPGGPTQRGDGGQALGRFQWHPDRQENLFRFAKENNLDPMTDEAQLRFADWELRNTERKAGDQFFAAKSLEQANNAMMGYLRPAGYSPDSPQGVPSYVNRYNLGAGLINAPNMAVALAMPPTKNIGLGPQPVMQQPAPDPRTAGDADLGGYGGSPRLPDKSSEGLLANRNYQDALRLASQGGAGLLAAGSPQQTWQPSQMPMLQPNRGDPQALARLPNFIRGLL